jgi:hypothetical protein
MSGDSQPNDDSEFLDDDFVLEDVTQKGDDLDQLFATPQAPAPAVPRADLPRPATPPADADEVLFTDHTAGLLPSERFQPGSAFDEAATSKWSGDQLELDAIGVPEPSAAAGDVDPALQEVEAQFTAELGSLLRREEEFALDSEAELELVEGAPARAAAPGSPTDGISEFEQSGPFVLDDSEGAWQQDAGDEAAAVDADAPPPALVELDPVTDPDAELAPLAAEADPADAVLDDANLVAATTDQQSEPESVLRDAAGAEAAAVEPGWEPLPSTQMDQLAEVPDVARTDADAAAEAAAAEPAFTNAASPATPDQLAAVDGHDIYAEEAAAPVLVGPRPTPRTGFRLLTAAAAAALLLGAGAAVVLHPEWFGVALQPERLQQVQLERPQVELVVAPPPVVEPPAPPTVAPPSPAAGPVPEPVVSPATESPSTPVPTGPQPSPAETRTPAGAATVTEPAPVPVAPTEPAVPLENPVAAGPTVPAAPVPTPTVPAEVPPRPVAAVNVPPPAVPEAPRPELPAGAADRWPAPVAGQARVAANEAKPELVRIGEDLMLGAVSNTTKPTAAIVDGVMPGSRAFAQLHNGNYFIGSVKFASAERITLRVDEGEVTLATAELSRFTELGSADYEELQKATSGFVRLTNNNRLVGGILSRIADDHIVLEFRSNRVMLPKSAIDEVVQGEGDAAVRLDVTREEDDWLRDLAERQLGTGGGPPGVAAPAPTGATKPAAGPVPPTPKQALPAAPPNGRQRG